MNRVFSKRSIVTTFGSRIMINSVKMAGNLTREPSFKPAPESYEKGEQNKDRDAGIWKFVIAVNKGKDKTASFFSCQYRGFFDEVDIEAFKKVYVDGYLDQWSSSESNTSVVNIIALKLHLLPFERFDPKSVADEKIE